MLWVEPKRDFPLYNLKKDFSHVRSWEYPNQPGTQEDFTMKYQKKWQDSDQNDWIDKQEWRWGTNDREAQRGQNSCDVGWKWLFGTHKDKKDEETFERRSVMSACDKCRSGDLKKDHRVSMKSDVTERRE